MKNIANQRRKSPARSTALLAMPVLLIGCMFGCAQKQHVVSDPAQRQMLSLLMPQRIQIVEPFTRVRSFDDDDSLDGIELLVQAVNALDDPGLMVVGNIRVELYEYLPASGEPRGRLLEHWDVDLSTAKDQKVFWNKMTQMYEFRMAVDPTLIPPAEQYVLGVTYTSPLGEHLTDDCLIRYRSTGFQPGTARTSFPE
ncbi:MAG: hypothetical protein AABZ47_11995 [Planctomycetota bacterium]